LRNDACCFPCGYSAAARMEAARIAPRRSRTDAVGQGLPTRGSRTLSQFDEPGATAGPGHGPAESGAEGRGYAPRRLHPRTLHGRNEGVGGVAPTYGSPPAYFRAAIQASMCFSSTSSGTEPVSSTASLDRKSTRLNSSHVKISY